MDDTYDIPKRGNSTKKERNFFWHRVIEDQKASGISAPKYCQKHQIPFSAFRNRLHRLRVKEKQNACSNNAENITSAIEKSGFIQVQVTDEGTKAIQVPNSIEYAKIKILFKNCNVMEFSLPATAECLSEIIAQVSQASC